MFTRSVNFVKEKDPGTKLKKEKKKSFRTWI